MARIRSIKPEFWADDNMLDLSDSCALFYVALWNFCDDEGKIENRPRTISKLTCRWSEGKVKLFIKKLVTCGRLRISICSTWLQVENWTHQKIDRPKQPKIKEREIQWVTPNESTTHPRHVAEHSTQGEDRDRIWIGEEGSDTRAREGLKEFLNVDDEIPRKAEVQLPDKHQIFEEIFSDARFVQDLKMVHPNKNLERAWEECWLHHSTGPSPPAQAWQWRQKLNTWLTNMKDERTTKSKFTDATLARREAFARKHGSSPGG